MTMCDSDQGTPGRGARAGFVPDPRLGNDPGTWRAPGGDGDGLLLRIEYELDPRQRRDLTRATGGLAFLDRGCTSASVEVRLVRGWSRTDLKAGIFGAGSSIVHGPDGAALFLDTHGRTYMQLAREQMPRIDPAGSEALTLEQREAPSRQSPVHAGRTERFRVRLGGIASDVDVLIDERFAPFASELARTLFALDRHDGRRLHELCERGLPVAGATYLREDSAVPAATWRVVEVRTLTLSGELFTIPHGWTDLRDKNAVEKITPHGGYKLGLGEFDRGDIDINPGWIAPGLGGAPALPPPFAPKEDRIGTCFDATYGAGEGLHVSQRVLDHLRFVGNLITERLSSFEGKGGHCAIDWLAQFKSFSDAQPEGDGLYSLLRWEPDPSQPTTMPDERYGGLGALDRLAEDGARRVLANGQHATLAPAQTLLDACNTVANKFSGNERFNNLSDDDRAALRELYLERRIARFAFKYPTDTPIAEWPENGDEDPIPNDLVRFKLFDIDLKVELQVPGATPVGLIEQLEFIAPNHVRARVRLHRIAADANVVRWPGTAWAAFATGAVLVSLFFPIAAGAVLVVLALATWLVLDAAEVDLVMRSPVFTIDIRWLPDAAKNDRVLWPAVEVGLSTTSKEAWYVSYMPPGLHQVLGGIITIALSCASEIEKQLSKQVKEALQDALRDDAKLAYPGELGRLGRDVETAGAFPGAQRLCLGAYLKTPSLAPLPSSRATQVDTLDVALARCLELDQVFDQAFRKSHPYAAFVWSQNVLDQFAWASWTAHDFEHHLDPATIGAALAQAVNTAMPGWQIHREHAHVFAATPPRIELAPFAYAAAISVAPNQPKPPLGDQYARIVFDDLRLCMPARDETVLEVQFSASTFVDIAFGALDRDGKIDLFASPDTAFDMYFDASAVVIGALTASGVRTKLAKAPAPQALTGLAPVLRDVVRAMLARRPSSAISRASGDARNVQRYGYGPLALAAVLFPHGGNLYAYLGLPLLSIDGLGNDPVAWLQDATLIPATRERARNLLKLVDGFTD